MKLPKRFLTRLRKNKDKIIGLMSKKKRKETIASTTCLYLYEDGNCCVIGAMLPPMIVKRIKKEKGRYNERTILNLNWVASMNLPTELVHRLGILQSQHDKVIQGMINLSTFRREFNKVLETGEV